MGRNMRFAGFYGMSTRNEETPKHVEADSFLQGAPNDTSKGLTQAYLFTNILRMLLL